MTVTAPVTAPIPAVDPALHHEARGVSDRLALGFTKTLRFCADTFFMCAGNMIQLHGGIGFTWEHDAHLFFKRARAIQSALGNGAWHRERIATQILGDVA